MVAGRVVMGTGLEPGGGGWDCERRLSDPGLRLPDGSLLQVIRERRSQQRLSRS